MKTTTVVLAVLVVIAFSLGVAQEKNGATTKKVDIPPEATAKLVFPIIEKHGGIRARSAAIEQPRAGAKVVFDITSDSKPDEINKGLDRVARLLNLYGAAGLKAQDVRIATVLHGDATKLVLKDASFKARLMVENNPYLPLIRALQKAGVEVSVCGQALGYKGFADDEVADGIPIAAAALTVVINKQSEGFAYIPVP